MSRRKLRPEELELWQQVAQTARRLYPEEPPSTPLQRRPRPMKSPQPQGVAPEFKIGARASEPPSGHDLLPGMSERLAQSPLRMDSKVFQRLRRGKLVPEGRLDLHGMTLDQAHPALNGFILRAQARGKRLVLVITGKGRDRDGDSPIPVRRGLLKHQVPQWLRNPPLSQAVLQVAEAHISHGGSGAYYVYLRRNR